MKHDQSNAHAIDELDDIRTEYKTAKRKLEKYDTFIDNNQMAIVFLLILLAIGGIIAAAVIDNGRLAKSGIFYASLALFPVGIIFAIISGARQSSIKKLEQKIEKLRREAALFQKQSSETRPQTHVTRDELGLYEGIDESEKKPHRVAVGFLAVIITIAIIAIPIMIAQGNAAREEAARRDERARLEQVQQEARDRSFQQQRDAINSQNNNAPTQCIGSNIGSTYYTNCY